MNILSATNLTVGWDDKAIATIDKLQVRPGEITVLAGPNGVGKSTTVKALARQIRPLSGSIELSGQQIWSLSEKQFAQSLAYVPQMIDPPHAMKVMDMVALGRNPHQPWWSWEATEDDRQAIREALAKTQTEHLADKPVAALSGGELQRVSIAMALAQRSTFILLDEPTAHLDYKHQLNLVELLSSLKQQQLGILLVLHDLNLIARLADQVALLCSQPNGAAALLASGPPHQVLTPDNLRSVYEIEVSVVKDTDHDLTVYVPISPAKP